MTKFTDTLPDLTKSPVPYPNPQSTAEVCANRLAAIQSGAVKHHRNAWPDPLEGRVAKLEQELKDLRRELFHHKNKDVD